MSIHTATVRWSSAGGTSFAKGHYSRAHRWEFDGGAAVPASASPHVVPAPWSDPSAVDPEEAFIASLSSCHMLFFLDFARRDGWCVEDYVDDAKGVLEKGADGKMAIVRVTLRPQISWCGDKRPSASEVTQLHHRAHDACFLANSVKTSIVVEEQPDEVPHSAI